MESMSHRETFSRINRPVDEIFRECTRPDVAVRIALAVRHSSLNKKTPVSRDAF